MILYLFTLRFIGGMIMLFAGKLATLALLLGLSFAWVPTALASDVARFEVDFFKNGSPYAINHATVWVSARRIRIEQRAPGTGESGPVLIYRGDEDRFISVHDHAKNYSVIKRKRVENLALEIQQARLAIERQLQSLPGDQRKAFEQLLGITPPDPEMLSKPIVVTSDNITDNVSGYKCTRETLTRGDVSIGHACVAPWDKIGLTRADMEIFRHLGNFQREAMGARGLTPLELVPNQPLDLLVQFNGFPLYYRRVIDNQQHSAIQVTAVDTIPKNDALFEPPKGYTLHKGARGFRSHLGVEQPPASPESQ